MKFLLLTGAHRAAVFSPIHMKVIILILAAIAAMGEGYHNYHHEFQRDYRNRVKPWQFDPTKWLIWTLSKLGLTLNLRRIPADKIVSAQAQTRNASC